MLAQYVGFDAKASKYDSGGMYDIVAFVRPEWGWGGDNSKKTAGVGSNPAFPNPRPLYNEYPKQ